MESNSKLNIYGLMLLPLLAAVVGGLVLLAMYIFSGSPESAPMAQPPSAQDSKLALQPTIDYLAHLFRIG